VIESKEQPAIVVGVLDRIIFRNDANSYSVIEVKSESGNVTACGIFPGVQCGETLEIIGTWATHEKHGRQFNAERFEANFRRT
jgi:hypothetical protein